MALGPRDAASPSTGARHLRAIADDKPGPTQIDPVLRGDRQAQRQDEAPQTVEEARAALQLLDAAYTHALTAASAKREVTDIRSSFDEVDRLQQRLIAASRRLTQLERDAKTRKPQVERLRHGTAPRRWRPARYVNVPVRRPDGDAHSSPSPDDVA